MSGCGKAAFELVSAGEIRSVRWTFVCEEARHGGLIIASDSCY
jgi:hypothetical protein